MLFQEQDFSFAQIKQFFIPLTTKKAICIIAIVGFLVYFNALFNGFVWDDITYILHNPEVHQWNPIMLLGKNLFNSAGFYRPIPALYFGMLYSIFSTLPFFYHIFQIIIHIFNAIFLFLLFKKFLDNHIACFIALLFLVHPMNVESVSYIAASGSVLFFFFGMIALLLSFNIPK